MRHPISLQILPTTVDDVAAIRMISAEVAVFDSVELATVDELLAAYFRDGAATSGYYFLTAHTATGVAGFACYGPRALTYGTYDLYWIVTNPKVGRAGVGGQLVQAIADSLHAQGGRLLIAETSGRADYAGTRAFYDKYAFVPEAVIRDFYAPGDDLYVYVKRI
jgi:GNAT superfamily N-acetyltransferase